MRYILLVTFIALYFLFPLFRCGVQHFPSLCKYGYADIKRYIKYKEWFVAPYGQIRCYIAQNATSFGCGKTLSSVEYIERLYNTYNDKLVYDPRRKSWVTQKIHVLSNVDFKKIPFEHLESLQQFVQETDEDLKIKDEENGTLTVTYLYIDEASSQLNSRSFKSNFNALFISRLLTSRHVRASIILTSQRANMVDKLMREVTNIYIGCKKIWRFQMLYYFDAYEMENAINPGQVLPIKKDCFFIKDSNFEAYDTYSSVQTLKKDCQEGKVYTDEEILALQGNPDIITHTPDLKEHTKKGIFRRRRK